MKNALAIILAIITVILFLGWFFFLPILINKEAIKSEIISSFKLLTGTELEIQGEISANMSPVPHVSIDDLYVRNLAGAKNPFLISIRHIDLYPSIGSLFKKAITINKVFINNVNIDFETLRDGNNNWNQIVIGKLTQADNAFSNAYFSLNNAQISYTNLQNDAGYKVGNIVGDFKCANGEIPSKLNIGFDYDNKQFSLSAELASIIKLLSSDETEGSFSIASGASNLAYQGKILYKDNKYILNGDAKLDSDDIAAWAGFALGNLSESASPNYKPLPLSAKSKIVMTSADYLILPEIIVDGKAITGKMSANITLPFKADIKADIATIDLENILANGVFGKKPPPSENDNNSYYLINKDANVAADIKVADISYNSRHIKDSSLSLSLDGQEITIPQAIFNLPGESKLIFAGIGKQSLDGFTLEGEVDAQGNDFYQPLQLFKTAGISLPEQDFKRFHLRTNTIISAKEVRLSELKLRIENMGLVGGIIAKLDDRTNLQAALNIDNLNIDNFIDLWGLQTWQKAFLSDNVTSKTNGALSLWLKQLGYDVRINALLTNYVLGHNAHQKAELKFFASKGKIGLDDVKTIYNGTDLSGSASVDVNPELPKLLLDVKMDKFDSDNFFSLNPTAKTPKVANDNERWSKDSFDFSWLNLLEADYKFNIGDFKYKKFTARNLDLSGKIFDRKIDITHLFANIFGARFEGTEGAALNIKGGAIPAININGSIFSLSTNNISYLLPVFKNMSGAYNFNFRLSSNGINWDSWIGNLVGTIAIGGSNIEVTGFNLPEIIRSISYVRNVADILDVVKRAISGGSTMFSNVEGEFSVSRGILATSNTKILNEQSYGLLTAKIDLPKWQTDTHMNFVLKDLDRDNPPTITVRVIGNIDAPHLELDTHSLEQYITNKTSENILKGYGGGQ